VGFRLLRTRGVDSLAGFEFNGVRFNPDWSYDGDVWYSGDGDLLDNWAIFEATGVTATSELTFDTYWDIEDNWDFGFVQVSTDNGANWTSLSNAYTSGVIDPQGHPDIAANLPGLTSWSCYVEADCWVNMSFDLSAYDGQDILIAFRFMTDWGFTYEGWYVDNVFVDGTEYDDFVSYAEFSGIENLYTVTLVGERTNAGEQEYAVETILSDDYMGSVDDFKYILDDYNTVYMLVTFDAPEGATSYADYSFEFLSGGNKPFKNKVR
jgi:bacillopeptidase F (M6 metalloprotease family)